MSSCILSAVGMQEMVVRDLTEYESLSYRLETQPDLLRKTKKKLNRNRDTLPLFDTQRFVSNLESAYQVMWDRYRNGEKAGSFYVVPPYMDGRSKRHNSGL